MGWISPHLFVAELAYVTPLILKAQSEHSDV